MIVIITNNQLTSVASIKTDIQIHVIVFALELVDMEINSKNIMTFGDVTLLTHKKC